MNKHRKWQSSIVMLPFLILLSRYQPVYRAFRKVAEWRAAFFSLLASV